MWLHSGGKVPSLSTILCFCTFCLNKLSWLLLLHLFQRHLPSYKRIRLLNCTFNLPGRLPRKSHFLLLDLRCMWSFAEVINTGIRIVRFWRVWRNLEMLHLWKRIWVSRWLIFAKGIYCRFNYLMELWQLTGLAFFWPSCPCLLEEIVRGELCNLKSVRRNLPLNSQPLVQRNGGANDFVN